MKFIPADIRPGGRSFYRMNDGATVTIYGSANYLELSRPHRVVYTQDFRDEHDQLSRSLFRRAGA